MPVASASRRQTFTLLRVELEVTPEPADPERAALEAVLERLDLAPGESPEAYRSAWRQAALADPLDEFPPRP